MRIIWRTIAVFVCLMSAIAVIGVIIILAFWPKLSEEEYLLPVEAVAFLPDGRRFATLNMAGPVRIWDVKTGRELRRIRPLSPRPSDEAGMIAMAVSPDGKYLAGSSNCENPDAMAWKSGTSKPEKWFARLSGTRRWCRPLPSRQTDAGSSPPRVVTERFAFGTSATDASSNDSVAMGPM